MRFCGSCAPVCRGGTCRNATVPWKTAHERLRLWTKDGTWDRILAEVIVKDDSVGAVEWIISVDSTVVRAHQHAAGARKKGGCSAPVEAIAVAGAGLGRSRGGLSTKVHLAVDGRGRPMRILITAGQAGDNPQLLPLFDSIHVHRDGPGRPRCRPDAVIADKAYSHPSTRQALRARRIQFVSPERDDQSARRAAKGSRGGRPPTFDANLSTQRNQPVVFKPERAGWWYIDVVDIREQGDIIHVVDHYVDFIVGPPGLPYRVLDLHELGEAMTSGKLTPHQAAHVLAATQAFADRHLQGKDHYGPEWPEGL